jgi:D,D-heptose 1,7-bisphosphate phosphatase
VTALNDDDLPRVRQAVILVGGLGSRLRAATASIPKPILQCGDRPFLAWLLRELIRFGFDEFVLLTGHLSQVLEAALPKIVASLPRPVTVTISAEPIRAGTGGALFYARHLLRERFILCNGDSILDFNLARLLAAKPVPARIVLRQVPDTDRYGVVSVKDDLVVGFDKAADMRGPGLVNAGIYLLERDSLDSLTPTCSLEEDVLPQQALNRQLHATFASGYFIDIGIPDDLARAQTELPAQLHRPALFLDRDGTINRDHGWVGTRERLDWIDGAIDAIRNATDAGCHVFIVTNQSGIARGLYSELDVALLHDWMVAQIRREGGTVDDIRYCPFHEEAAIPHYRRTSECRKPRPGMLLDLIAKWELSRANCLMVGDQSTDMAAAHGAGIQGLHFDGINLSKTIEPWLVRQSV